MTDSNSGTAALVDESSGLPPAAWERLLARQPGCQACLMTEVMRTGSRTGFVGFEKLAKGQLGRLRFGLGLGDFASVRRRIWRVGLVGRLGEGWIVQCNWYSNRTVTESVGQKKSCAVSI